MAMKQPNKLTFATVNIFLLPFVDFSNLTKNKRGHIIYNLQKKKKSNSADLSKLYRSYLKLGESHTHTHSKSSQVQAKASLLGAMVKRTSRSGG